MISPMGSFERLAGRAVATALRGLSSSAMPLRKSLPIRDCFAGRTLDRKGRPLTLKLSGSVEAWFKDLGEDAPVTKKG